MDWFFRINILSQLTTQEKLSEVEIVRIKKIINRWIHNTIETIQLSQIHEDYISEVYDTLMELLKMSQDTDNDIIKYNEFIKQIYLTSDYQVRCKSGIFKNLINIT